MGCCTKIGFVLLPRSFRVRERPAVITIAARQEPKITSVAEVVKARFDMHGTMTAEELFNALDHSGISFIVAPHPGHSLSVGPYALEQPQMTQVP